MSKASKMYDKPPTLERDDGGKLKVKKSEKANAVQAGTEGMTQGEDTPEMPMHARHAMDHERMHGKHMAEHAAHDHGKKGDKKEMHARHETEMKAMHHTHEKELKTGGGGKAEPKKEHAEMPKEDKKAKTDKAGEKA